MGGGISGGVALRSSIVKVRLVIFVVGMKVTVMMFESDEVDGVIVCG